MYIYIYIFISIYIYIYTYKYHLDIYIDRYIDRCRYIFIDMEILNSINTFIKLTKFEWIFILCQQILAGVSHSRAASHSLL